MTAINGSDTYPLHSSSSDTLHMCHQIVPADETRLPEYRSSPLRSSEHEEGVVPQEDTAADSFCSATQSDGNVPTVSECLLSDHVHPVNALGAVSEAREPFLAQFCNGTPPSSLINNDGTDDAVDNYLNRTCHDRSVEYGCMPLPSPTSSLGFPRSRQRRLSNADHKDNDVDGHLIGDTADRETPQGTDNAADYLNGRAKPALRFFRRHGGCSDGPVATNQTKKTPSPFVWMLKMSEGRSNICYSSSSSSTLRSFGSAAPFTPFSAELESSFSATSAVVGPDGSSPDAIPASSVTHPSSEESTHQTKREARAAAAKQPAESVSMLVSSCPHNRFAEDFVPRETQSRDSDQLQGAVKKDSSGNAVSSSLSPLLSTLAIYEYLRCVTAVYRLTRQGVVPPPFLLRKLAELLTVEQIVPLVTQNPSLLELFTLTESKAAESQRLARERHRRRATLSEVISHKLSSPDANFINPPDNKVANYFSVTEADMKRGQLEMRLLELRDFQAHLRCKILQTGSTPDGACSREQPSQQYRDSASIISQMLSRQCHSFLIETPPDQQLTRLRLRRVIRSIESHRSVLCRRWHMERELFRDCAKEAAKRVETLRTKRELARDRERRERMKYLKENDIGKYLEMVKQSKNARIKELLAQTDRFLTSVRQKMVLQQGATYQARQEQRVSVKCFGSYNGKEDKDDVSATSLSNGPGHSVDGGAVEDGYVHDTRADDQFAALPSDGLPQQPSSVIGGLLMPYQLAGLQFLVNLYDNDLSGILADEMGLGKTVQAISFVAYLREFRRVEGPHLIIVPLSTLPNWITEFQRWCPSLKVLEFRGNRQERRQLASRLRRETFHVCVTTYDWVIRAKSILAAPYWGLLIVDEGHRMKNVRSKFHATLTEFHSTHRLLLTGTPLQNNLSELWSLLNFLLPKIFTSSADFEMWFEEPFKNFYPGPLPGGPTDSSSVVDLTEEEKFLIINRLHSVLRPFLLRRVKEDVLDDLPDKREYVVRVQLSVWQKMAYERLSNRAVRIQTSEGKISHRSFANVMMQLRKIVNHPYLFEDEYYINENLYRVSGKFEVLDRMLPKLMHFRHKTLIFCQMTQIMDLLDDYFEYKGYSRCRLDGSTVIEERRDRMLQFNDPKSSTLIFTLSTRAGGLGINLQAADTVIIFDSDWNPHQDLQAQARAHRFGQKKEVRVFRLVTVSGIEEAVLSKAQHKLDIDEKIIQAGMFNNRCTDEERQQRLRTLLYPKGIGTETCVTTPQELNRFLARTEEEEAFFQNYDRKLFGPALFNTFERHCVLATQSTPHDSKSSPTPSNHVPQTVIFDPISSSSGTHTSTNPSSFACKAKTTGVSDITSDEYNRLSPQMQTHPRTLRSALRSSGSVVSQDVPPQDQVSPRASVRKTRSQRSGQQKAAAVLTLSSAAGSSVVTRAKRATRRSQSSLWESETSLDTLENASTEDITTGKVAMDDRSPNDEWDVASGEKVNGQLPIMTEEDLLIQSSRLMNIDEIPSNWLVSDLDTEAPEDGETSTTLNRSARRARQSVYQETRNPFTKINTEALSEAAFERALRRLESGEVTDFEMAVALEKTRQECRRLPGSGSRISVSRKRLRMSDGARSELELSCVNLANDQVENGCQTDTVPAEPNPEATDATSCNHSGMSTDPDAAPRKRKTTARLSGHSGERRHSRISVRQSSVPLSSSLPTSPSLLPASSHTRSSRDVSATAATSETKDKPV